MANFRKIFLSFLGRGKENGGTKNQAKDMPDFLYGDYVSIFKFLFSDI